MDVEKFGGFTPPVSNYFRMPVEWINISAEITNLAEMKVVEYVLRHTWGYHEYDGKPKPITVDEFMYGRKRGDGSRIDKGTGLKSDRSVKDGIKAAIEHGYLICEVDASDKARIVKAYALKMLSAETRQVESTPQSGRFYPSEVQNLPLDQVDSTPRSEKETKERYSKKDTLERKNGTPQQKPNISAKQEATHSSIHPLPSSQNFSSSQETKLEEVTLTEEEQVIYDYACQTIFKAKSPRKTAKLQSECAEIAKHVKTAEQFTSLVQFVRALPYIQGQVHLKNLVNELNGWLQMQNPPVSLPTERKAGYVYSSYDDPDYVDNSFYPAKRKGAL
jgi:hypothetical protein